MRELTINWPQEMTQVSLGRPAGTARARSPSPTDSQRGRCNAIIAVRQSCTDRGLGHFLQWLKRNPLAHPAHHQTASRYINDRAICVDAVHHARARERVGAL